MSDIEIAWMAGILEGEGSFCVSDSRVPTRRSRLRAYLEMTDKDVIERVASITKSTAITSRPPRPPERKEAHRLQWTSQKAEDLMLSVLSYMGERRKAKIEECLITPNLSHHGKVSTCV